MRNKFGMKRLYNYNNYNNNNNNNNNYNIIIIIIIIISEICCVGYYRCFYCRDCCWMA